MTTVALTERQRVVFTLVGLADAQGRIWRWSPPEAYAFAQVDRAAFEGTLETLKAEGLIVVDESRRKRRFTIMPALMQQKRDADRYVNEHRVRVASQVHDGTAPRLMVENLTALPSRSHARVGFDLVVYGVGSIRSCVYVLGERAFVAGPSRRNGGEYEDLVRFDAAFAAEIRQALDVLVDGELLDRAQALRSPQATPE